ncbi:MAG: DUF1292 domain-containing protein [Lachnospiraceae bacterium]|nr:DUF1292 domain-containing protein [Lachnospiraceae bacterium]
MEKIILEGDQGESIELYPLETTRLAGVDYILAADTEAGDGTCYILKDVSKEDGQDALYEMVEDEKELDLLLNLFSELLEDVDLEG